MDLPVYGPEQSPQLVRASLRQGEDRHIAGERVQDFEDGPGRGGRDLQGDDPRQVRRQRERILTPEEAL
jgi:hypothetical protein